jgi:organic hydroperoxide reductase OsmC/OhrA
MNVRLGKIAVSVKVHLEGDPLITTAAAMEVRCETLDGSDAEVVIERAKSTCMVSNSLKQGIPITIQMAA